MSRFTRVFILLRNLPLLLGVLLVSPAQAWGPAGHHVVGAIADQLLANTPAAQQVQNILGMDLQTAAVWLDCARGVSQKNGQFSYSNDPARYPDCAVFDAPDDAARFVDYIQHNWDACHPTPDQEQCHAQYHYTDVAIQRDAYVTGETGTSDHDVVHALQAAITVLQGGTAPAPFVIKDQRTALLMIAHLAGDLSQPLHVAAIYLDKNGKPVDPDQSTYDPATGTVGGNALRDGKNKLHTEWDDIPASLSSAAALSQDVKLASAIPAMQGDISTWPQAWATDTLGVGKQAFAGLKFKPETGNSWALLPPGAAYATRRVQIQGQQLVKGGAWLAQILRAIWPDAGGASH